MYKGFVLRESAGGFYLLNLNHPEEKYIKPLKVNEMGAYIFQKLSEGKKIEDIARKIADDHSVPFEEVLSDSMSFLEMIKVYGVPVE